MVAAQQLQPNPLSTAEDLRKHVIRLMQTNGEETRGNISSCRSLPRIPRLRPQDGALSEPSALLAEPDASHPDRWVYKSHHDLFNEFGFKESVVRRLLHGDPQDQAAQAHPDRDRRRGQGQARSQWQPNQSFPDQLGRFPSAIRQFLDEKQAGITVPDSAQSAETNLREAQIGKDGIRAMDQPESAATLDQEITSQTSSEETSSESSDFDDDLQIFLPYRKRFGKLKAEFHEPLREQLARLGIERVGQVLERCSSRGRSWKYVLAALANEAPADTAQEATADARWDALHRYNGEQGRLSSLRQKRLQPVSERIMLPWRNGQNGENRTVQDAWNAVFDQLTAQLGSDFRNRAQGLTLVDFEANTFVVTAKTAFMRDELEGRLARTVQRILNDVAGQEMALQVLLEDEWVGRYSEEGIALSA